MRNYNQPVHIYLYTMDGYTRLVYYSKMCVAWRAYVNVRFLGMTRSIKSKMETRITSERLLCSGKNTATIFGVMFFFTGGGFYMFGVCVHCYRIFMVFRRIQSGNKNFEMRKYFA